MIFIVNEFHAIPAYKKQILQLLQCVFYIGEQFVEEVGLAVVASTVSHAARRA